MNHPFTHLQQNYSNCRSPNQSPRLQHFTPPSRSKPKTVLLTTPSSSDGPWATHSKAKGKRATYEQTR